VVYVEGYTANTAAIELGAAHARFHALDDQRTFQLGNGGDDYHNCPAQRAIGIYSFPLR
jgi:hypothetical protein